MSNLYLISPEYVEQTGVAISGSSTAAGMPWSNLLTPFPHERARSTNLTTVYFELDFGAARAWDSIWLGYSNARSATNWRIRAADTQGNLTAAPNHDSGTIAIWPASSPSTLATDWPRGAFGFYNILGATVTRRWLRVDITDGSHPDGYFQFGCLIPGLIFTPTYGWAYGGEEPTEVEPPDRARSISGVAFPTPAPTPAKESVLLKSLSQAEYRSIRRLYRLRGSHKHVLVVKDPTDTGYLHENTIHGLFTSMAPFTQRYVKPAYGYGCELSLESMG